MSLIYSNENFILNCSEYGGVRFRKIPPMPTMKKAGDLMGTLPPEEAYECLECSVILEDPFKQLPTRQESDQVVELLPHILDDHFADAKRGPLKINIALTSEVHKLFYSLETTWEDLRDVQKILLKVLDPTPFVGLKTC